MHYLAPHVLFPGNTLPWILAHQREPRSEHFACRFPSQRLLSPQLFLSKIEHLTTELLFQFIIQICLDYLSILFLSSNFFERRPYLHLSYPNDRNLPETQTCSASWHNFHCLFWICSKRCHIVWKKFSKMLKKVQRYLEKHF